MKFGFFVLTAFLSISTIFSTEQVEDVSVDKLRNEIIHEIEKRIHDDPDLIDALSGMQTTKSKCTHDIRNNSIIKTDISLANGAEFLGTADVVSYSDCIENCCETQGCNTAVFKSRGDDMMCYMFDCKTDGICDFTYHEDYFVSHINQSQHKIAAKHENDLDELAAGAEETPTTHISTTSSTTSTTQPPRMPSPLFGTCRRTEDCAGEATECTNGYCVCRSGYSPQKKICRQDCSKFQFQCKNDGNPMQYPQCIAIYDRCDGIQHCQDNSDEIGCDDILEISQQQFRDQTPINDKGPNMIQDQAHLSSKAFQQSAPNRIANEKVGIPSQSNSPYNAESDVQKAAPYEKSYPTMNAKADMLDGDAGRDQKALQRLRPYPPDESSDTSYMARNENMKESSNGLVKEKNQYLNSQADGDLDEQRTDNREGNVFSPNNRQSAKLPGSAAAVPSPPTMVPASGPSRNDHYANGDGSLQSGSSARGPHRGYISEGGYVYGQESSLPSQPRQQSSSSTKDKFPGHLSQMDNNQYGSPLDTDSSLFHNNGRHDQNLQDSLWNNPEFRKNYGEFPGYQQTVDFKNKNYNRYANLGEGLGRNWGSNYRGNSGPSAFYQYEESPWMNNYAFQKPMYDYYELNQGTASDEKSSEDSADSTKQASRVSSNTSQHSQTSEESSSEESVESSDTSSSDSSSKGEPIASSSKASQAVGANVSKDKTASKPTSDTSVENQKETAVDESKMDTEAETPVKSGGKEDLEAESVIVVEKVATAPGNTTALVALSLGLILTALLLIYVGCRLRHVRQRLRKGRPMNSNEADYLINGMYL